MFLRKLRDDGHQVLDTRYVITEKPDGSIKARFVVKGFQETSPKQSDSPTAGRETLKLFLSIVANEGWRVEGSDVRSAFLQAEELDRNVYIQPPPELKKTGYVWKLRKPLYGLDDSSRKWFLSSSATLTDLGMAQSLHDSCLFYYHKNDKLQGLLLIHVDDYLSAGTSVFQKEIIDKLRKKYIFGTISHHNFYFTGIHIVQDENMQIMIDQNKFLSGIETFNIPRKDPDMFLNREENRTLRRNTGQLNWASSQTRPDISYDAFFMSSILNKSRYRHFKQMKKLTEKVKDEQLSLKFQRLGEWHSLKVHVYADASLGNTEENGETKSVMGYLIMLTNSENIFNPIHWKTKIIERVAEDIKSAETLSLESAVDDAIYISSMLTEIYTGRIDKPCLPLIIKEDSKSLIESLYSTKKSQTEDYAGNNLQFATKT